MRITVTLNGELTPLQLEGSELLVPIVVFFALQRFFVRGILAGSVKG